MPAGHQKTYHVSPGKPFASASWKAYLPYNEQGVKLLRRLQYAFLHGLNFTVHASSTTVQNGEDTYFTGWASIPHKTCPRRPTSVTEGSLEDISHCHDSFPDPFYVDRCNQELDRLGVPATEECQQYVAKGRQGAPACSMNRELGDYSSCGSLPDSCRAILKSLQSHQHGWMFCRSLPAVEGKVKKSMDLSTVERKLNQNEYGDNIDRFIGDVVLTFDNALATHGKENPVHFMAKQLKKKFKKDLKEYFLECET